MNTIKSEGLKLKAKRTFIKKGTCSRTFFYILDREFGHPRDEEEKAIDPMAGGILQQGYQCGMLWGAAMAVGAEALRRYPDPDRAREGLETEPKLPQQTLSCASEVLRKAGGSEEEMAMVAGFAP